MLGAFWANVELVLRRNGISSHVTYFTENLLRGNSDLRCQILVLRLLLRRAHSILPVRPHEPNNSGKQDDANHRIELMKVLPQLTPVLP